MSFMSWHSYHCIYIVLFISFILCQEMYALVVMLCHLCHDIYGTSFILWHLCHSTYNTPCIACHLRSAVYIMPFISWHLCHAIYVLPLVSSHLCHDIFINIFMLCQFLLQHLMTFMSRHKWHAVFRCYHLRSTCKTTVSSLYSIQFITLSSVTDDCKSNIILQCKHKSTWFKHSLSTRLLNCA